jgi:hypothetical protein
MFFEVVRFNLLESVKNSFERNNTDTLRNKYEACKLMTVAKDVCWIKCYEMTYSSFL